MGSAASPLIVDDAIAGLAQPLTKALNQLSRGPRRACDVIEELGRREDFYLHLAGGSRRRTAGAIFHNAHLPYKLSRANRAEKDGVAIEFPEYVRRKTLSAGSPSLKRTCPLAKCVQVISGLSIGNRPAQLAAANRPSLRRIQFGPRLLFFDRDLWDTTVKLRAQVGSSDQKQTAYAEALSIALACELMRVNESGLPAVTRSRG